MMAFSRLSPFGMMFKPLMESHGADLLTWFREDFLAKTYPAQEREQELTEADQSCGSTWQELSVKYDLDSHSWRTHLCLWDEELPWSSVTLPKWGMCVNGVCWEADISIIPKFCERDSGWLPAPMAQDGTHSGGMERTKNGRYWNLRDWYHIHMKDLYFPQIPAARSRKPEFWEWAMGWPEGWTELNHVEMDNFHDWQQQHGEFLANDTKAD
jgi:hypothetical protein